MQEEISSRRHNNMFAGTRPQLIASLTATISAVNDGMHYGWSAPVLPILESENSPISVSKTNENWLETMYLVGGVAGLPITVYLVDKIGRKNSTIASSCTSLLSWILIALAPNLTYLYIARLIAGMAGDMAFVATPMYVAEIADQKIRGLLSSLIYLMMLVGILLIYVIAPLTPFYVPSIVGGLLLIFQLCSFSFMPQSPYYLLASNQAQKAKKALDRLRVTANNDKEFEEIRKAVERQRREKGRPQDLLLVKNNRTALFILTALNMAQHFSGFSVLLMNMHTILSAANSLYFTSNNAAMLFAACMLLAATLASFIVDKYGRKLLLKVSGVLTGMCLLGLAVYFHLQYRKHNIESISWLPVVLVMLYATVYKLGLGMVPVVMTAELYSNKVKAMGMTLSDAAYLIFALLSVELHNTISKKYGYHVVFYIFACCAFGTTAFTCIFIPETKGQTLEEIQMILQGRSSKKVNSEEAAESLA